MTDRTCLGGDCLIPPSRATKKEQKKTPAAAELTAAIKNGEHGAIATATARSVSNIFTCINSFSPLFSHEGMGRASRAEDDETLRGRLEIQNCGPDPSLGNTRVPASL